MYAYAYFVSGLAEHLFAHITPSRNLPSEQSGSAPMDEDAHGFIDSDDESHDADPNTNSDAAAAQFANDLVELYMSSVISAQTLCVLCHWAKIAGAPGVVTEYAKAPGAQSGSYQKYLNRKMGLDVAKKKQYAVQSVALQPNSMARAPTTFYVKVPREAVDEEAM